MVAPAYAVAGSRPEFCRADISAFHGWCEFLGYLLRRGFLGGIVEKGVESWGGIVGGAG